jgi:hypothetical protein
MAIFEIDLRDSEGTPVDFGDLVRVTLPAIEVDRFVGEEPKYIPERIVDGRLILRLSTGLMLKIVRIVKVEDGFDPYTEVGQVIPLRRSVWRWYKLTERDTHE